MRLTRLVARLPNVAGTSNPPRTASAARAPARALPHRSALHPARRTTLDVSTARPSTVERELAAPATAHMTSPRACSSGPTIVTSSAAADRDRCRAMRFAQPVRVDVHRSRHRNAVPGSPTGPGPGPSSAFPADDHPSEDAAHSCRPTGSEFRTRDRAEPHVIAGAGTGTALRGPARTAHRACGRSCSIRRESRHG